MKVAIPHFVYISTINAIQAQLIKIELEHV